MTAPASLSLSPFYWDLRNKVVRPWDNVGQLVSKYFWRRWQPLLGSDYTVLIIQLRVLAADPACGGQAVVVSHQELAESTGQSLRAIQRLLSPATLRKPELWFLGRFLRIENRYSYDPATRKKVRIANAYAVAIDDPLHPEDEDGLNIQLARREQSDLRAQGFETRLPVPPMVGTQLPILSPVNDVSSLPFGSAEDEEALISAARAAIPDLALSVLGRLLHDQGADVLRRQLDWFPQRDNSWARNGPAAAFVTYCKEDRPPPPAVRRQEHEDRARADMEAHKEEYTRVALAEATASKASPPVWDAILMRLPKVSREAIGSRLTFLEVTDDQVLCRCPTSGDALMVRKNQGVWDDAASAVLGRPMRVVLHC